MYSHILLRFGELSTKGKNKMTFVRRLEKNIKNLLSISPKVEYDRMFIDYSIDNINGLNKIFGLQSYSPVVETNSNKDDIEKVVLELIKDQDGTNFKVRVKRAWKDYPGSSMEIASRLGALVLENSNKKVKMKDPDFIIEVEIRESHSYIFVERIKGLGGYPTGINGKVLHLMSGGIDSPVGAYEMMKRGIHVDYLNFITPPHTDEKTKHKVNSLITLLTKYQGSSKLFRSEYTDLMNYIGLVSDQSYKIVLMRRSFYRIANKLAKKHGYLGISNGDNVGQVASQTLESMNVIQEVSDFPIYRPILTADKLETTAKGIRIGTYEISIVQANEACELFAPKKPVIKPSISNAYKLENELEKIAELEEQNIKNHIEILNF